MERRKKAAELIIQSRQAYYHSESIQSALEAASKALSYLNREEISPYFVEWLGFLYASNHIKTPENLKSLVPNDIRFLHLNMQFWCKNKNFRKHMSFLTQ